MNTDYGKLLEEYDQLQQGISFAKFVYNKFCVEVDKLHADNSKLIDLLGVILNAYQNDTPLLGPLTDAQNWLEGRKDE